MICMSGPRLDTSLELLVERVAELKAPAVLATIVATAGSTYRKAGARMLLESDGTITGLLSGGCFEQDIREHASKVFATGMARGIEYDMRGDADLLFGIGAGCEGAMRILLEPASLGSVATRALIGAGRVTAEGEPAILAIVHEGPNAALGTRLWPTPADMPLDPPLADACADALLTATSHRLCWDHGQSAREAWIQHLAPPPKILLCGGGLDAEPLVAHLRMLRFQVTVAEHRPAYALAARFPGAKVILGPAAELATRIDLGQYFAAIVMSHHLHSDAAYLRALAASTLPHIGLLGPQPRRARLMAELGDAAASLAPRLRGPVGLDLGAVTPEGIALAIAAELHALAAGRNGGPCSRPPLGEGYGGRVENDSVVSRSRSTASSFIATS
jgi:xanthine dehydrogenase accessory factor